MDSTEAYIRHRERIHAREKQRKLATLKKKYPNAQIAEEKVEKVEKPKEPEEDKENDKENMLELYKELMKIDETNKIVTNKIKLEVVEIPTQIEKKKAPPKPVEKKKVPKHKKKGIKKAPIIDPISDCVYNYENNDEPEEEVKFKPKMAGKTGLPVFFFSNLVKNSRTAILSNEAKNKMNFKSFPPKD